MKKTFFITLSILLFFCTLNAQTVRTPEDRAKEETDRLTTQLSLTSDQGVKVYNIVLERIKQIDVVLKKYMGNLTQEQSKARGKELQTIRNTFETKLKTILTPQQYDKWVKEKNNRKDKEVKTNNNAVNNNSKPK